MKLYQILLDTQIVDVELFLAARLVNISAKEIRNQMKTWRFKLRKSDSGEILVPKEGVIKLIKLIDTQPCWDCYNQLWADAHELDKIRPELKKKDLEIAELKSQLEELKRKH